MRRNDKEIRDLEELETILRAGTVCRIALCKDGVPYIVPLSYGYAPGHLWFHCAPEGQKMEMLRENPAVCFEVETDVALVADASPCKYTLKYKSVIGYGTAVFINQEEEKREGLHLLMQQYGAQGSHSFAKGEVDRVCIVRLDISSMTGKRSGYQAQGGQLTRGGLAE